METRGQYTERCCTTKFLHSVAKSAKIQTESKTAQPNVRCRIRRTQWHFEISRKPVTVLRPQQLCTKVNYPLTVLLWNKKFTVSCDSVGVCVCTPYGPQRRLISRHENNSHKLFQPSPLHPSPNQVLSLDAGKYNSPLVRIYFITAHSI